MGLLLKNMVFSTYKVGTRNGVEGMNMKINEVTLLNGDKFTWNTFADFV